MRRGTRLAAGFALGLVVVAGAAFASGDGFGRLLLRLGWPRLAAAVLADPAWRGVALYEAGRPEAAAKALKATRSVEAAYNLGNALARSGALEDALVAYDIALLRNPDDGDARANRALVAAAIAARDAAPPAKAAGTADAHATMERRGGDNDVGDDAETRPQVGDGMAGQREAGSLTKNQGSSRVDRRGAAREGEAEGGKSTSTGAATDSAGRTGRSGGMTEGAESEALDEQGAAAAEVETAQATRQWLAAIPDDPARFVRLGIVAEHRHRLAAGTAEPPDATPW